MDILIVVLIVIAVINLCYMIASLYGLKLDVEDPGYKGEVAEVKRTRNFIKYFPIVNVAAYIVALVMIFTLF